IWGGEIDPPFGTDALERRIESGDKLWFLATLTARALDMPMPLPTPSEREYLDDNGFATRVRWSREIELTIDVSEAAYDRRAGLSFWTLIYPNLMNGRRRPPSEASVLAAMKHPLCPIIGMIVEVFARHDGFYDGEARYAGSALPWRTWLLLLRKVRYEYLVANRIGVDSLHASLSD
ncbi:MAG: hypothetical protein ACRDAM_08160, partial [Casimicrobium sp.]